jgi:undecaprenyl-diphosphatase
MDDMLFQRINGMAGHNPLLDSLLAFSAGYGPLILIGVLAFLWFWPRAQPRHDRRQRLVVIAVLSVCLALLINQIIILLWARPRPFEAHVVTMLLAPTREPSFPSDHATFAFAVAVAVLIDSVPLGVISLLYAAVIAVARVYVGEHYVSDVLGGALIGALCTLGLWRISAALEPVMGPLIRFARRLHVG